MARPRSAAGSRRSSGGTSEVAAVAERMISDIEGLVREIELLRADNAALRSEMQGAVEMMERASAALSGVRERGPRGSTDGRRRAGRRAKGAKGRATPAEVTTEVVRAVLAKLGEATAAEIAAEITKAGAPVSGRAVRFLAERAGAHGEKGPNGQVRYRL